MNPESLASGILDQPASLEGGVRTCSYRDGLAAIREPDAQLVIWQRALPSCLRDWISETEASSLPEIRILVEPDDLRSALEPLLDESGLAAGEMRDLLVDDIGGLVRTFANVSHSDAVDVRLERVEDDACWKFHRDNVSLRLVTTYRGPTTEWIRSDHAERALEEQRQYSGPMERLGDHDVAIFKGSRAGPQSGIVHRSPPVAGTGITRLFLCLNKRSVVSPDPWTKT